MKKTPYTIIIFGIIDILFFFPIIWYIVAVVVWDNGMFHNDPSKTELSFVNAPENTAYIDLLVKPDDNSGGYVSLSELTGCEITVRKNGTAELDRGTDFSALEKKYGAFKAAYVDENGNVLGVTETAEWGYNGGSCRKIFVDGDSLLITRPGRSPAAEGAAFCILTGVEGIALAALAVFTVMAIINSVREKARKQL